HRLPKTLALVTIWRNGLDFQLSDEQLQLKKMVRDFAEREIAPNVMKWDEPGTFPFETVKELGKLGLRASDTSELIFEDCEIPAENLLGQEGQGFVDAMKVLDGGRISIAALEIGIGRGALDAALKYVKERRQFGKAIAEFQGIQWKLADMATELDAARLLTQRAAVLKDAGRKVTRESSMAKLFSSEAAVRISDEAVQLFGGYGFIEDYPAEKYYRD